jgi:hypothetical protein
LRDPGGVEAIAQVITLVGKPSISFVRLLRRAKRSSQ